jgi:hypothetical protein
MHNFSMGNIDNPATKRVIEAFNSMQYAEQTYDVQVGELWDTRTLSGNPDPGGWPTVNGTGSNRTRFFSYPDGQQVDPDYDEQTHGARTNMRMSRRLPAPEAFSVSSYVFTLTLPGKLTVASVYDRLNAIQYMMMLGNKCYHKGPLLSLPMSNDIQATGNPIMVCSHCTSAYVGLTCPHCGASRPTPDSLRQLDFTGRLRWELDISNMPIVLENQMDFGMEVSYGVIPGAVLRVSLKGLHARGVQ